MPTYTVATANIALSPEQKAMIASAITAAHNTHTGAPGYFAQVIFAAVAAGDHFIRRQAKHWAARLHPRYHQSRQNRRDQARANGANPQRGAADRRRRR